MILSCLWVGSHTGTHCDEIAEPETEGKVVVFAIASLLVVLVVVGGIATAMIVANKRQRARQQERLAREEEERHRLLQAKNGKEEEGLFGYVVVGIPYNKEPETHIVAMQYGNVP